ncbi:MAG: PAS domain S-box protein [Acidobacteriota bacterium]|nr:PAS domain S-box protein [Acidobacteriota bacterium]
MDAAERSAIESLVQYSDERCRKLVAYAEDGVWLFDAADRTLFADSEMARMLGLTAGEMLGAPLRNFLAVERTQRVDSTGAAVLGNRRRGELALRQKDGNTIWVSVAFFPILDKQGAAAGRAGIFTNVTARKRAESALRESERRYRDLFSNAPVGIYRTTSDGLIYMCNDALVSMLGYTSFEELTGQDLDSEGCGPIYQRESFRAQIERDGEARGIESVWKRRDNSVIFVRENAKVVRDANGRILYFEGTVEDITERRLAEDRLQQSEARLRSLIDNAPYGIYRCDSLSQRFLTVNPALVEMLGYESAQELLGLHLPRDLFADHTDCETFAHSCRLTGRSESEVRWKKKDGHILMVRLLGRQSREPSGGLCLEAYVEDISQRAELEQQLRQAQKMEAIGNLAGGIAHDFNNLLMIISSYTQMIEEELEETNPVRQHTRQVLNAVNRSTGLIQQLLAFSRKQILSPRILDLNSTVDETAKMIRRLIGEDIELVISLQRPLPVVKADPAQISQVLLNLCVNARDAMPRGGRLTVSTMSAAISRQARESMPGLLPGAYSVLNVSDTGIGMPPAVRARIFEPFFTTKPVGKGTGLGLSTVYGIVKQSGGYIGVESELDCGTTFQVYFPSLEEEAVESERSLEQAVQGNGETILVAEDEDPLRKSVAGFLERNGYRVMQACNGEEALQTALEHDGPIHLLLTDVVMPKLEGVELARQLGAVRPEMSTIFVSGYTDHRVLEQLPSSAKTTVLQKPLNLRSLLGSISQVLTQAAK